MFEAWTLEAWTFLAALVSPGALLGFMLVFFELYRLRSISIDLSHRLLATEQKLFGKPLPNPRPSRP